MYLLNLEIAEARSGDLRHWFVAGYGVARSLPQPGASDGHPDPLMSRLNPLFDKGRLIGTGFIEELEFREELEFHEEYLKTLQQILSGERDDLAARRAAS